MEVKRKTDDSLQHHGIKGQRWGIRRYQNYDGTYTQKGLKRYKESVSNYENTKEKQTTARSEMKEKRKSSDKSEYKKAKAEYKKAKAETKSAKADVETNYKKLKNDYTADKGKELYKKGKTITDNSTMTKTLADAGGFVATGATVLNSMATTVKTVRISQAAFAVGTGMTVVAGIKTLKDRSDAKKLRAYYAHTS